MGIYSYELFNFFNVESIIRIGSAGSYKKEVKVRDIVIAQSACTDSSYSKQFNLPGDFSPIADFSLLEKCAAEARRAGASFHVGNILSTDAFYGDLEGMPEYRKPVNAWSKMGVLAVEMEAAALYVNAKLTKRKALAICTCSNHLYKEEEMTAEERERSLVPMVELGLSLI